MKLKLIVLLIVLSDGFSSTAQETRKQQRRITLTGTVTDSATLMGIAGATVELNFESPALAATYSKDSLHRMAVTTGSGQFRLENIPLTGKILVTAYALGYKINSGRIILTDKDLKDIHQMTLDIGNIKLTRAIKTLGAVVVSSVSKQLMVLEADKKVYNAGKSTVAQGGTTIDLLKNIPSVEVDGDGNVTMRSSSPQILVDGRPTLLTPEQIPADIVDKVELITNPSSKYDAAASGGIINIVLKKNRRVGINGLASIGGGMPALLNGNLNVNFRQKKINLTGAVNYNQSGGSADEETYRQNKTNGMITDYFEQTGVNDRLRKFHTVQFGADYFIDKKNTLSFVQNFTGGNNRSDENQFQSYFDQYYAPAYSGIRASTGSSGYHRSSSRLSYERKLPGDQHTLTADFVINSGNNTNNSAFTNKFYSISGDELANPVQVNNEGGNNSRQFTGQIDYSNKITEHSKIEAGLRSYYNSNQSFYNTFSIDASETAIKLPLNDNLRFAESVNAGYFNYSGKWKSWSYQAGVRMEFSKFNGTLIDSNYSFGYRFPDGFKHLNYSFFPSIYLTKTLDENNDLQLNYSKRIRRPGFWQVNPFVSISNPLNIRQGNADLKPEYTNSFEVNYFRRFSNRKGSLLASLYFQNNVGDITQYSDTISAALLEQLKNASLSAGAILNTYINAGYTNRTGAEIILQKKLTKSFDINYSLDLQYRKTKARINSLVLDNEGFNLGTKITANYKILSPASIFNNLSFQLTGNYQGPRVIPQGRIKDRFFSDFAIRKEFMKNKKASLSFSINDLFNSRRYGTIYDTKQFYQDSYRRWNVRTFRLTFSYRFGNPAADLFRKKDNSKKNADDDSQLLMD